MSEAPLSNEDGSSDEDSLFGDSSDDCLDAKSVEKGQGVPVASRKPPHIPGLRVYPDLLSAEEASRLWQAIVSDNVFCGGTQNQVMLFPSSAQGTSRPYLETLETRLRETLRAMLSKEEYRVLLDPETSLGRQVILNLYRPGEGISPHIDLPARYGDGIIGVCLGSECVMDLERELDGTTRRHAVYLPERTVYCLSGEARWEWRHGIPSRLYDRVESVDRPGEATTLIRDVRVSITLRWMKEGADVVGN